MLGKIWFIGFIIFNIGAWIEAFRMKRSDGSNLDTHFLFQAFGAGFIWFIYIPFAGLIALKEWVDKEENV